MTTTRTTPPEGDPMTASDYLDRLDALHAETTPGEWSLGVDDEPSCAVVMQSGDGALVLVSGDGSPWLRDEDAEFIAAAHEALPRLTNALRAVLELHTPCEFYPDDRYEEAGVPQIECNCCGDRWPCQTVTAITDTNGDWWRCPR